MSIQINTDVWQEPITLYTDMNVRTGATDLDNPDFEDYPPFVKNDLAQGHEYTNLEVDCLYSALLAGAQLPALNQPIDTSIAYCACKNMGVPINNIFGYCTTPMTPSGYPPVSGNADMQIIESRKEPLPIMFMHTRAYQRARAIASTMYSPSASYANPFYTNSTGRYNCNRVFMQGALNADVNGTEGSNTDANGIKASNANLFCAYYRDFGIRSVYGVIFVKYYTSVSSTNMPNGINDTPLDTYAANTSEWRAARPICCAYMRMYYRSNIDGSYQTAGWGSGFKPDLTLNLISMWDFNNELHIGDSMQQPVANYIYNQNNNTCPIFGVIGADMYSNRGMGPKGTNAISENVALLIGGTGDDGISQCQGTGSNSQYLWCTMEGTDENIENIRKWAACYGLFFTGNNTLFTSAYEDTRWTHPDMMLGVVDNEGYTDGTYTRGTENPTANNWDWKTASESRYDPDRPPPTPDDPTIYSDTTDFNLLGGVASCNKMYAVQASSIMNLARALSTAISLRGADVPPLDYSIETFLTNNPLDCIISLRYYPTTAITSGTEEPIAFGSYTNASVTGIPFVGSFKKLDFHFSVSARNALYPHFGDFRDYEPYTHAELIVPFCGTVPINPCDFIGHDINVHMIVDYITGSCTAYIAADGLVVTSIAGQIGIEVPLSGMQQATLDGQRVNAVLNRQSAELNATNAAVGGLTSAVGFAGSLAGDNIVGAIGSGAGVIGSINRFQQADISYQKADYDLKHMQVPYKTVSAGTPVASTVIESCCRLIIYRPVMDDRYNAEVYAQTVGFACLMNGAVNEFTGLTVGNINTDGLNVTESEKQMIQKAFANGVIL